jgi:hypothetical protein
MEQITRRAVNTLLATLVLVLSGHMAIAQELVRAGQINSVVHGAEPNICPSSELPREAFAVRPSAHSERRSLTLARGCPKGFTDGNPDPADIDVSSCHTTLLTCAPDESALDCGKRALMAGDWELAVQTFTDAPSSCETQYGQFLARLFRLYANFNNQFFSRDSEGTLYNQIHRTVDLNIPLTDKGRLYQQHYSCLADQHFLAGDSLIDALLEQIWANDCRLHGLAGGPLPIRWVQGRCEAPLLDTVMVGVWDRVDAVLTYQYLFGSPTETKRFRHLLRRSNDGPCDGVACQPLFVDDQEVSRLPADSEWLLNYIHKASNELFNPQRDPQAVYYWRDADGNGHISPLDQVLVRWCDATTGQPTLELDNVTVAGQWTYDQAPPPGNPSSRRVSIYLNPDGSRPPILAGEVLLNERPPAWLVMVGAGNTSVEPSPDGQQMAFSTRTETGLMHLFVTEQRLDADGKPVCRDRIGNCCLTCKALPGGIRVAVQANPRWIPDPTNPGGPALGVFFMHNDYPSSWGWGGEGQGGQFYAIRPDGSALTSLLPVNPPYATNYQPHVARDSSRNLFWTSTWNPATGGMGPHNLLLGDLSYDPVAVRFTLHNIHSVLPKLDQGWYEAHLLPGDFAADPLLFFTSTAHSMQSTRGFMGRLGANGMLEAFFKLTHPDETNPDPFMIDYHPAWNEHFKWVDRGRQITFQSSDTTASAADRYDWFLAFPPYLEGVLLGLTSYHIRFAALYPGGYLVPTLGESPPVLNIPQTEVWISNIDGTNRERLFQQARNEGWDLVAPPPRVLDGRVYAVQEHRFFGRRYVVMQFED